MKRSLRGEVGRPAPGTVDRVSCTTWPPEATRAPPVGVLWACDRRIRVSHRIRIGVGLGLGVSGLGEIGVDPNTTEVIPNSPEIRSDCDCHLVQ